MQLLKDLFSSDVGLMSAAAIAITLGMGAFHVSYFLRHVREDAQRASSNGQ